MKSYERNFCPFCTKGFLEKERTFRDKRDRRWHFLCAMNVLGEITRIDEDRTDRQTMAGQVLYIYKVHASAFKESE